MEKVDLAIPVCLGKIVVIFKGHEKKVRQIFYHAIYIQVNREPLCCTM